MADMLVKLYALQDDPALYGGLAQKGVSIRRVLSPDRSRVLEFVRETFSQSWADECETAFAHSPVSCFIAVRDHRVVGFACYDCTEKDFFGPTGVLESERGSRIGTALLLRCLSALRDEGYAYAVIGGVEGARGFYEKTVGALWLEGTAPGIYDRLIGR